MRFPLHFLKFAEKPNNMVVALRTSGPVKKGETYTLTLIDSKGRVAVKGDDQWLPMDMFAWFSHDHTVDVEAQITATPANDNE